MNHPTTPERAAPVRGPSVATVMAAAAAPPVLWFAHLNVSYLLVPDSCRRDGVWGIALATAAALAAMAPAVFLSRRAWRTRGDLDERDVVTWIGGAGLVLGALFAAATLLVGASGLVVDPCH